MASCGEGFPSTIVGQMSLPAIVRSAGTLVPASFANVGNKSMPKLIFSKLKSIATASLICQTRNLDDIRSRPIFLVGTSSSILSSREKDHELENAIRKLSPKQQGHFAEAPIWIWLSRNCRTITGVGIFDPNPMVSCKGVASMPRVKLGLLA